MQDELSVALRALSLLLVLQAAGAVLFTAMFAQHLQHAAPVIRRLTYWSAVVGIGSLIARYAVEITRMAGEMAGLWDRSLQIATLGSSLGSSTIAQVLGLAIVAVGSIQGARRIRVALIGAGVAIAAFLLTGHTAVHPQRWALASLLLMHLSIVAFWLGALLPLVLVIRLESAPLSGQIVRSFSAIASWLVPGILVAGLCMALILIPTLSLFARPYGLLLLGKAVVFAVPMGLASLNKWRFGPALAAGEVHGASALRRTIGAEYLLICAALVMTAALTTLFSPD